MAAGSDVNVQQTDVPGIDVGKVTEWLQANVTGATGPFEFHQIAGGHSNLTFRVTGADGERYVLRRPPLGQLLASAHDVGREHRIISALAGTAVPVAPVLGMCTDVEVTGTPFYVMAFVDGIVARTTDIVTDTLDVAARGVASASLIETLAALHAIDPASVGLGDLGRHENYIARQLKRWSGQYEAQHTERRPNIERAHELLTAQIPEQGPARIVHGDYRLDNTMVDPSGKVIAVLDWEICTLGDPLADLGLLMVYWTGPGDAANAWRQTPTAIEGFWDRTQLAQRYAELSGRDLTHLDYYTAFAFWKLACIIEGVYSRYLAGALGDVDHADVAHFNREIDEASAQSVALLEAR
jgi:aminoglycoside phosphotransferase (APT) family kinase protein